MKMIQDTSVVVYGAGEVGNNVAANLLKNGYVVQGFLDMNANVIKTVNHIKVYQVNEEVPWDKTDIIIIIALANGNVHKDVANSLYRKGYQYIVFLPISYPMSKATKKRLIMEYNQVMEGKCKDITVHKYTEYNLGKARCEDGIIEERDEYVWTFLAQEILFTESYENWKGDKNKLTGIMSSYDRNIVLRKWYRSLFRYYDGAADCEEYFKGFKIERSEIEKKEILNERQKLFQLYKMEYNRGLDFFIETAPLVEWNENGYFNLIGGHHRTVFLLEQGLRSYPVKMTKTDFQKWCNYEKLEFFETFMDDDDSFLNMPIPHPAYSNYIFKRENTKITLLDKVLNFFEPIDTTQMSVLDVSQVDGYFARIFSRLKVKEVVCYETDFYERVKSLFELLYVQNVKMINEFHSIKDKQYDIIFVVNPNSLIYESKEFLFNLLNMSSKYIFLEMERDQEYKIEHFTKIGNFRSCKKFSTEVFDGVEYTIFLLHK